MSHICHKMTSRVQTLTLKTTSPLLSFLASSLPLLQPVMSSFMPSPSRSKEKIAVAWFLDLILHHRVVFSYTPTVPLARAYPNLPSCTEQN